MVAPFGGGGFNTAATGSMTDYQRWLRRRQAEAAAGTLGTTDPAPGGGFSLAQSAPEALGTKLVQPFIQPGLWGGGEQAGPTTYAMRATEAAPPPATPSIPPPVPTLAGGPPPVGPGGMAAATSNPNGNGVATGAWAPVAYDPNADTARWELNGKLQEGTMDRARRQAGDMVRWNPALNYNHVLDYIMANQSSDYRRGDGKVYGVASTLGYDPNQFVDNTYGERYDPNKVYRKGGGTAASTPRAEPPGGGGAGGSGAAAGGTGGAGTGAGGAAAAGGGGGTAGAGGTSGAADASGLTYATRDALVRDPKAALRYMLQQRGLDPDSGGWATKFLQDNYGNAVSGLTQMAGYTNGSDGIAPNEIVGLLGGLGNSLFSRGGDAASYLRNVAARSLGNAAGDLGDMGDSSSMPFYENANYLAGFGGAAAAQNARQNQLNRLENQYGDAAIYGTLGGDASVPQTFAEFMKRRGYSLFR